MKVFDDLVINEVKSMVVDDQAEFMDKNAAKNQRLQERIDISENRIR